MSLPIVERHARGRKLKSQQRIGIRLTVPQLRERIARQALAQQPRQSFSQMCERYLVRGVEQDEQARNSAA